MWGKELDLETDVTGKTILELFPFLPVKHIGKQKTSSYENDRNNRFSHFGE